MQAAIAEKCVSLELVMCDGDAFQFLVINAGWYEYYIKYL